MSHTVPPRSEIAPEHTWNRESVFPSVAAWHAERESVLAALPDALAFEGRLGEGAAMLADWFALSEPLMGRVERLTVYGSLAFASDMADAEAKALSDQGHALYSQVRGALAFAGPEIVALGAETLGRWVAEEPRLAGYEHFFANLLRQAAHLRSSEVEALLGQLDDPFRTAVGTHRILSDMELPIDPVPMPDGTAATILTGNLLGLLTHPERAVRQAAWENHADAHLRCRNTMANVLLAGVKQNVLRARVRRYPSALAAALDEEAALPESVFHALIEAFQRNLPTWHRYWRVRRQALGYDTLHPWDIFAPLSADEPRVPYEQAVEWIAQGMVPLGPEYVGIMRDGLLEERWVDRYPNQGKRGGAFSGGVQGTHPFIFMSYQDDLLAMSTLTHEIGHSMHSYLTRTTQPHRYADYSTFAAEVASNFNQVLVRAWLLDQHAGDPAFQIAVIEEAMKNFHRYLFVMPTLARFELELHQAVERGGSLSADAMVARMAELFAEGYGAEMAVDRERVGITWAQFPTHMYLNFYVFQYATGIAAAHALGAGVLAGEPGVVDRYLTFLRSGSSEYPLDALRAAGVDMTTPEPVERAFAILADYVARLETLVGTQNAERKTQNGTETA